MARRSVGDEIEPDQRREDVSMLFDKDLVGNPGKLIEYRTRREFKKFDVDRRRVDKKEMAGSKLLPNKEETDQKERSAVLHKI